MTLKNDNSSGSRKKADDKSNATSTFGWLSISFLSIVFLIRAGYYFLFYLQQKDLYFGEVSQQGFASLFLLIAFFYFMSVAGLIFRKSYAYYLSWLVVLPDILLSGMYLLHPDYAFIGIPLTLLTIVLLMLSKKYLKPADSIDRKVAVLMTLAVIAYLLFAKWTLDQPRPEEYQKIVTKEAIDKSDVSICDKLSIGKNNCIREYAENKADARLCDLIDSDYNKDRCYLHIADSTNNPELCKLIKDEYDRGLCYGASKT